MLSFCLSLGSKACNLRVWDCRFFPTGPSTQCSVEEVILQRVHDKNIILTTTVHANHVRSRKGINSGKFETDPTSRVIVVALVAVAIAAAVALTVFASAVKLEVE